MSQDMKCSNCGEKNIKDRYFCPKCGKLLQPNSFSNKNVYEESELKIKRILENLNKTPHSKIIWNDTIDLYTKKVEKYQVLMRLPEIKNNNGIVEKLKDFLELCIKPEFQIAFVGTIKTGKSTLINSLLGHNYASMAVTPETAALTKFRSSPRDYVKVTFYSKKEWKELWDSRTSAADAFMNEYKELNADSIKDKWVGHETIYKEIPNDKIREELLIWSSSKYPEHYFVKEIEVGISSLPEDFPPQVVFVDTPGLLDPVAYRSEITKQYIRKANAVFVCVDAQKVQKSEIETISSVFSFSSHNKSKVHIIATHWDKLNKPIEDWKVQKEWLEKQLVGKGFFDTKEMAHTNIMHSAAHIYNLCRDFNKLEYSDRMPLFQFALGMKFDISILMTSTDKAKVEQCLSDIKNLTNIEEIHKVITSQLAKNYEKLLYEDIAKKYEDIVYTLKRIAKDEQKESLELIEISKENIEKMKAKVEEQKKNYDKIVTSKEQLNAILKSVERNTQKRLDTILPRLKKMAQAGKTK